MAELVAVVHAVCAHSDTVVDEKPPELAVRALKLDLWNLVYENTIWTSYAYPLELWLDARRWTEL